jgi:menaquinone-9 beta-reductase
MNPVDTHVIVIGGGPAGLAAAIGCAQAGLSVHLFERQRFAVDKACGEGLMPRGIAALDRMGVLSSIDRDDTHVFHSISFSQNSGETVRGTLSAPYGLGIRRLALSRALVERAVDCGVVLHPETPVLEHSQSPDSVTVFTDSGAFSSRFLVAADGLHSPTRKREGLLAPPTASQRFGLRRHFKVAPWSDCVEVTFERGVEAYVTPSGSQRVGVAFLFDRRRHHDTVSFDALLQRFPALAQRLAGAEPDSKVKGAGPLHQRVTTPVSKRVVLVGDAAGYVDAITGEGLSLAFDAALSLGPALAKNVSDNTTDLSSYVTDTARVYRRYRSRVDGLLFLSRHDSVRFALLSLLARAPWLFGLLLRRQTGGL